MNYVHMCVCVMQFGSVYYVLCACECVRTRVYVCVWWREEVAARRRMSRGFFVRGRGTHLVPLGLGSV